MRNAVRIIPMLVLIALVTGALYLPVQIPYVINSIGMVYPHREWKLLKDDAGNLTTSLQDFKTGVISAASNYPFERGDLASMYLQIHPDSAGRIYAGDTVLEILNIRIDDQILQLEGELARTRAELSSAVTGDKPPIVLEAEQQVRYAAEDLRLKQKVFDMQQKLYDEQVISQLEYRMAENTRDLAQIQLGAAKENLENMRTGVKPEDVDIVRKRISALENRIRLLRSQKAGYRVLAPFGGKVMPSALPTDVVVLHDNDEYIVQIPVPVEEAVWIGKQPDISVVDAATRQTYSARLIQINPKVEIVNNRQVVFLQTSVQAPSGINTGLGAICTIKTGELNPREYIARVMRFNF